MRADDGRGRLDGMLLAALEAGPLHGYGVIELVRARSGGAMELPTGTVYPALNELERRGLLTSAWSTASGRRRRSYELTVAGRRALSAHREQWASFASIVSAILAPGLA